jgi:hypothetical protein
MRYSTMCQSQVLLAVAMQRLAPAPEVLRASMLKSLNLNPLIPPLLIDLIRRSAHLFHSASATPRACELFLTPRRKFPARTVRERDPPRISPSLEHVGFSHEGPDAQGESPEGGGLPGKGGVLRGRRSGRSGGRASGGDLDEEMATRGQRPAGHGLQ